MKNVYDFEEYKNKKEKDDFFLDIEDAIKNISNIVKMRNENNLKIKTKMSLLQKHKIKSFNVLQVLQCVMTPCIYEQIHNHTGIRKSKIKRIVKNHPDLFHKDVYFDISANDEKGKNPTVISITETGKDLLINFFK